MQRSSQFESDASEPETSGDEVGGLRDDLEAALSADFAFTGKFAHSSVLAGAPSPCIHVDGMGLVPLPLSPTDAQTLRAHAKQAPFGHGDQTVIDTAVRNTWEIPGDAVTFTNPAWGEFMVDTVAKVADALGVSYSSILVPRCELHKLLLYETGSQ